MPRPSLGERVTFVIRLPVALATELRDTAEREDIPVNAAVQRAVTAWVERGVELVAAMPAPAPKKPRAPKAKPVPDPSVPAQPPASPSREVPTFFKKGAK